MEFNRLTEKSQEAIRLAQSTAVKYGNQQVDVEHLLLAMIEQEGGLAPSILLRADVKLEALHKRLIAEIEKFPKVSGGATRADQVYITNRLSELFNNAEQQAKRLKDEYISIEHLLLAVADDQGIAGRLLREFGLTHDRLMKALLDVRGHQRVTTPESRNYLRSPPKIRPRSHRCRQQRQARSRHRPR